MEVLKYHALALLSASCSFLMILMCDSMMIKTICIISSFINGMTFYEAFFHGERSKELDFVTFVYVVALSIFLYFSSVLDKDITIAMLTSISALITWILKKS